MVDVKVRVETGGVPEARADVVVAAVAKGATRPDGESAALDERVGGVIGRLLASGDFKGSFKETAVLYPATEGGPRRVLVVGTGDPAKLTVDRVRQLGARVAKKSRDAGARTVALPVLGAGVDGVGAEDAARALAEGCVLALYEFKRYKTGKEKKEDEKEKRLDAFVLHAGEHDAGAVGKAAERGATVGRAVNRCRDWASLSGEDAHARNLAKDVQKAAKAAGLACEVLDEKRIKALGMGGVLAVNQGSAHPPRVVALEHGKSHKAKGTLVLVGKGVTFDSGGISIKPSDKMEDMKFDKSGAAAVWGAMLAVAELDLPVHVVGLTPIVENMPSGTAIKPGDVYTAMNGKTVEIINTDAEGRLILADALAYAERYAPDAMIDVATLTGHVVVAFGHLASGLMGNDRWILDKVKASAERVNEPVGEFPFLDGYDDLLESRFADLKHHGGRPAGAITAGKFLAHFVPDGVPWAHLDVAGTAHYAGKGKINDEYSPAEATGVPVRTFVDLVENWSLDGRPKAKAKAKAAKPAKAKKSRAR